MLHVQCRPLTSPGHSKHLENLKPSVDSGFWLFGGAFMDKPPAEGEPLSLKGSVMLAMAGSKDEVLEKLRADPYFEANVWDFEKVSGFGRGDDGRERGLLTKLADADSDLPVQERYQEGVVREGYGWSEVLCRGWVWMNEQRRLERVMKVYSTAPLAMPRPCVTESRNPQQPAYIARAPRHGTSDSTLQT